MPAITFYQRMIAIRAVNEFYNENTYTGSDGTTEDTLITPIDIDTEEADGVPPLAFRTELYIKATYAIIAEQFGEDILGIDDDEYMQYVSAIAELKTFSDFYKSL